MKLAAQRSADAGKEDAGQSKNPRGDDKFSKLAGNRSQRTVWDRLNLIQHLCGYVKCLRSGVIIGAGNGIRQNRLNLIQKFTVFHTTGKIHSCRACFARTFHKVTNIEIEIVIVCCFV